MASIFRRAIHIIHQEENDEDLDMDKTTRMIRALFGGCFQDYNHFSKDDVVGFPFISGKHRRQIICMDKKERLRDIMVFYFIPFYANYDLGMRSPEAIKSFDETADKFELKTRYELTDEDDLNYLRESWSKKPGNILRRNFGNKDITFSMMGENFRICCREEGLEFRIKESLGAKFLSEADKAFLFLYKPLTARSDIMAVRTYVPVKSLISEKIKMKGQG